MTDLAPTAEARPGPGITPGAGAAPTPGLPKLTTTASITTFGHLAWIGWVWLAVGVVVSGITVTVGTFSDGRLTESLWEDAAAGWQPWLVLGAGVATTSTFAPMLIGNGVTRARLSASVTVTMVVLAVVGSAFVAAGYLVEGVVFRLNDWSHVLGGGGRTIGTQMLAGVAARHVLTLGAYFVSGWLIGVGFYRFGRNAGIALIPPSLVPAALVELLLLDGGAGVTSATLDDVSGPPLAVGAPASAAVVGVAALVAGRYMRDLALRE
jgi:hypothetical protein